MIFNAVSDKIAAGTAPSFFRGVISPSQVGVGVSVTPPIFTPK